MSYLQTGSEKLTKADPKISQQIKDLHQEWRDDSKSPEGHAAAIKLSKLLRKKLSFTDDELKIFYPFRPHVSGNVFGIVMAAK